MSGINLTPTEAADRLRVNGHAFTYDKALAERTAQSWN